MKKATSENHKIVLTTMITLTTPITTAGVFGDNTSVNKLKKNSVALGLRTFVKKPIFTAEIAEISFLFFGATPTDATTDLARNDLIPI